MTTRNSLVWIAPVKERIEKLDLSDPVYDELRNTIEILNRTFMSKKEKQAMFMEVIGRLPEAAVEILLDPRFRERSSINTPADKPAVQPATPEERSKVSKLISGLIKTSAVEADYPEDLWKARNAYLEASEVGCSGCALKSKLNKLNEEARKHVKEIFPH